MNRLLKYESLSFIYFLTPELVFMNLIYVPHEIWQLWHGNCGSSSSFFFLNIELNQTCPGKHFWFCCFHLNHRLVYCVNRCSFHVELKSDTFLFKKEINTKFYWYRNKHIEDININTFLFSVQSSSVFKMTPAAAVFCFMVRKQWSSRTGKKGAVNARHHFK